MSQLIKHAKKQSASEAIELAKQIQKDVGKNMLDDYSGDQRRDHTTFVAEQILPTTVSFNNFTSDQAL